MTYKATCPKCLKRISRRHLFFGTVNHRCRGCGIMLRMAKTAWLGASVFFILIIGTFLLEYYHFISPGIALIATLVVAALAVWTAPYRTPMHVRQALPAGKL